MNTHDIIAEAKKRLSELEAEADKLRRMIAAAEGTVPAPVVPVWPTWPLWPSWPVYPGDTIPSPFIVTGTSSTLPIGDPITGTGTALLLNGPVGQDAEALKRAGLGFSVEGTALATTPWDIPLPPEMHGTDEMLCTARHGGRCSRSGSCCGR